MYLLIKGNIVEPNLVEALTEVTNKALVKVNEIDYNFQNEKVSIPILRFSLKKKKYLRGYSQNTKSHINSVLIIRNVITCTIKHPISEVDKIHLLFGLQIGNSSIYLSSAEESNGVLCYELDAQLRSIDIELIDKALVGDYAKPEVL